MVFVLKQKLIMVLNTQKPHSLWMCHRKVQLLAKKEKAL